MTGEIVGHYRIEELLGEGAWGKVYRALDIALERPVALKVLSKSLHEDEAGWGRMLREARLASSLNHPNICTIYEVGEDEGRAFIAMEYVDGLALKDLIPEEGLPSERVVSYATQIAEALAHAHDRGIVHGDIKTSNILVTPEATIKLLDFGLARRFRREEFEKATSSNLSLLEIGPMAGTLPYVAPEVLHGKPTTAQSDIWALGVVLYEMVSGHLPFKGETTFELSTAIMTGQPEALPAAVPAGLSGVIAQCLEKDPARRYQTAGEAHDDLRGVEEVGIGDAPKRHWDWRKRILLPISLSLIVLLGVLISIPSTRTLVVPAALSDWLQTKEAGSPDVVVWVNKRSEVYHCPDSRWYGKTKQGEYMTQKEAQGQGYTPARGMVCN